jgi:hypothetical protein
MGRSTEARISNAAGGVADEQAQGHGFNEGVKARFAGAKSEFRGEAIAAAGGILQLAMDSGDEAGQILLGNVIVGAGTQGNHRGFLRDGAGKHDEGKVETGGLEQLERGGTAEVRKIEVGEDDVRKLWTAKSVAHVRCSFDAGNFGYKPVAAQMPLQQCRIVGAVFHEQNGKWS